MSEPVTKSAPEASPGPRRATIIRSKIAVPRLPDHFVERSRVGSLLCDLLDRRRIVLVTATAGSGKTTAVVAATQLSRRPIAWLTLDRTDAAPGRLVTYLEAALAQVAPDVEDVATGAVAAGVPHAEAAGLLAEATGEPLVLVIDELERLGEEAGAWGVIEALVRYAPPDLGLVLISRREIPATLCTLPLEGVAVVGESDLAFHPVEAADALALVGKSDVDAAHAVEVTGGWVAGVLFEAWRSTEHVAGTGGEADPFHSYLSSQILGGLDPRDREFLETTSLLDEVTARGAEALGLGEAGNRLIALKAAHLPVTWSVDGHVMRCHSRFREYLLERLERRGDEALRGLRAAHGRLLVAQGDDEAATEEFIRAGVFDEALVTAERAIMPVIERMDFEIAERWLKVLADVAPTGASPLTTAELMLALAQDDIRHVVRIADQLEALGERDVLAARSETATWVMALGYMHVLRPDDVSAILVAAQPGPAVDAVEYAARVMGDPPGQGKPRRPDLTGTPVDAFIYVADWALGRLASLSEDAGSRWVEAVKMPWRISALRAMGHTQSAFELIESHRSLAHESWVGPEALIDAGKAQEARDAIAHGRGVARASGSLAFEAMNALAEARLALRLDRDPVAARAALERPGCVRAASEYRLIDEFRATWYGLALLRQSDDAGALERLRRAVEGMVAGDRILELPTAAVYLSEAEWRAGNEDAADRAADLALTAARRQGSNHLLLQALADFPAVVSRQIDAQPGADSAWHDVGRALIAQGVGLGVSLRASVELREFGERVLLVDGDAVRPPVAKTYELLAYLATRRPHHADRQELLEALFDARSDESTRSYLRQTVRGLRQVLPEGAVEVQDRHVSIREDCAVRTQSTLFEAKLVEAARLQGMDRLAATLEAIEIYDQGEYLPGARSNWAEERFKQLTDLVTDARYEAAELALNNGRYDQATVLNQEVLRIDPFREGAWRLAMRIADGLGDEKAVLRAYLQCEETFAQLGAAPAPATKDLLGHLRR